MKNGEEKYVLTLTREQAQTAMDALELYARLRIGQFNRITELLLCVGNAEDYCQRRDIANDLLRIVACIILGRNIYGQPDCQADDLHYRAWNIYAALRHKMAWHDHPEGGWTVNFDKPFTWGGEAVPDCKVEAADSANQNGDLISRADAIRQLKSLSNVEAIKEGIDTAIAVLEVMQAVQAEHVRHGYWTHDNHACGYYMSGSICSECNQGSLESGKFCPNCGAKMDAEAKK